MPAERPLLLARYRFDSPRFAPVERAFDVHVCDGPVLDRADEDLRLLDPP